MARRTALIPYLTAGYPSPAATPDTLRMLDEEGADIIEVGFPFSDPVADGPVIQDSTHRALQAGMTVGGALDIISQSRVRAPIIAFSYLNPLLAYGISAFLHDAAEVGIAGVLVTDLPAGTDPSVEEQVAISPLALIRLIALTTDAARLPRVLRDAQGFAYVISRLGVTGGTARIGRAIKSTVAAVRAQCDLPVAVGFGIDSGEKARRVAEFADGVVVGSALVLRLGESISAAGELMRELRGALDGAVVA